MISTDSKFWVRALSVTAIAAAGLVLSGCSLLSQVTGGGAAGTGNDDTSEGTEDDVFSLVPGDCFNEETNADTISTVDIVECSVPHKWEAFESIIMNDATYPGEETTQAQADDACNDPFTAYVGLGWDESIYDYSFYYPTEDTWNDPTLQDREILCLAFADDESMITGSIKGANK
ncbi:MAG: septum formation family protein [Microbacteriaceae bacterium]|nr:septum formation family protein [Microbacteriaceae bacterium]